MSGEEEEEDDYMSDKILAKIDDSRPGLLSRSQVRKNELEKTLFVKNNLNQEKNQSIKAIEEKNRNDALSKSIIECEKASKGLNMMKKMGFKIGESLGKEGKSGIIEPIGIKLKHDREGLGGEEVRKRKLLEVEEKNKKLLKQRLVADELNKDVYMKTKRQIFQLKQIKRYLRKAQNVCYQLDISKNNVKKPVNSWYWPRHTQKTNENESKKSDLIPFDLKELAKSANEEEEEDDIVTEDESEEKEGDEEEEEDDEEVITKRLQTICVYLRDTYIYCIYCGTYFNDINDINKNCPGPTKEDHDEN